jgi:hypothetical protein
MAGARQHIALALDADGVTSLACSESAVGTI